MKKLLAALVMASLAGLTGCPEPKSGTGGGGGGRPAPGGGAGGGTFTIEQKSPKSPTGTVEVTQGETVPITLDISRKNFSGDVDVDAKPATGPGGLSADEIAKQLEVRLESKVFPGDKQDATVTLQVTAKPDAKLGDYGIHVTGKPKSGAGQPTERPLEIKVHVKARGDNKPSKK
jgi:uncharacterized membrane protein